MEEEKISATEETAENNLDDTAFPEPTLSLLPPLAEEGEEEKAEEETTPERGHRAILDDSAGFWPTADAPTLTAHRPDDGTESTADNAPAQWPANRTADNAPAQWPAAPVSSSPNVSVTPAAETAADGGFEARGDYTDFLDETLARGPSLDVKGEVERMGIVGGRQVGKSYLFQSIVFRTLQGGNAGALSHYIEQEGTRLFASLKPGGKTASVNLNRFLRNYSQWIRLPTTRFLEQKWYRLRLHYRTGFLGRRPSQLDVEYFDGSGEGFFAAIRTAENARLWRDGYLKARIMVFCLPAWVAFPNPTLSLADWEWRDEILEEFDQVLENFRDLREENGCTHPVKTILALTMADDSRCALEAVQDRWILPYVEEPTRYLRQMRTSRGVALYLENARRVSEAMHEELEHTFDPRVGAIRQHLTMGAGKPWIVPMSAIDGSVLAHVGNGAKLPAGTPPPVPVHVELPLLLALCERSNALL